MPFLESLFRTLKRYVKIIVFLLWLYVGLVFMMGTYTFVTGHHLTDDIINKGRSLFGSMNSDKSPSISQFEGKMPLKIK